MRPTVGQSLLPVFLCDRAGHQTSEPVRDPFFMEPSGRKLLLLQEVSVESSQGSDNIGFPRVVSHGIHVFSKNI